MVKGRLDIIIINWNGGDYLCNCINSILNSSYTNYFVHIIDNGSTDGSIEKINVTNQVFVHLLETNLGFGKACNKALNFCEGEFVLLLNPDTIIKKNSIEIAIDFLKHNPGCTVYGCLQLSDNNKVLRTCGRFPNFFTFCNDVLGLSNISPKLFKNGFIRKEWNHSTSAYVDHVMGSFYFTRRSVIDQLGFMDENYFVYLEDLDLSLRIKKTGGKIYFDSANNIYHKGGGLSEQAKSKRLFYILHAKHEFIKKNFSTFSFISSDFVLIFLSPFARILYSLLSGSGINETRQVIQGYLLLYRHLFFKKQL